MLALLSLLKKEIVRVIDKDDARACSVRGARNVSGIRMKIVKGAPSAPDNTSIKKLNKSFYHKRKQNEPIKIMLLS